MLIPFTATDKTSTSMRITMLKLATLWILLLPFAALATAPVTRFDRLSIVDGLSQSVIFDIAQDPKGFLWIATSDGLNRYDGYGFKIFRHNPKDPESIANNFIQTLYIDSKGALWVGTGDGLDRFDADTEHFVHFKHQPANPNSLSHNSIRAIVEDNQNNLWIGTVGGGLNQFDLSTKQFTHYRHSDANSLSHDNVSSLHNAATGGLWIGTDGGLNHYDPRSQTFSHYQHNPTNPHSLSSDSINTLIEDSKGRLWLGTRDGLNRFDGNNHFERFKHQDSNPHSLSFNDVRSLFEDNSGTLWVGTQGGGLSRYRPNTNNTKQGTGQSTGQSTEQSTEQGFVHFKHQAADPNSLSGDIVWSIHQDKQGALWVGTFGAGLSKTDKQRQHFGHFNRQISTPHSLSHNAVLAMHKDHTGALWIGTENGLNRLNDKNHFEIFKHQPSNPRSLSHNRIWAIHQDTHKTLWIGTLGGGVNRYNPSSQDFSHLKHQPSNPDSLSHNDVMSILQDSKGLLWIGTRGGGLNQYNDKGHAQNQHFRHFKHHQADPHSLSHDIVSAIFEDSTNTLWFGTFGGGINRFDRQSEQFVAYQNQPSDPDSLSHNGILSFFEDSHGTLWIGTFGGLNKFDRQNKRFTRYTRENGLVNDVIYGILEDNQGQLWLSTNMGLSRFDPQAETFRHYDAKDGLQSNEFNFGAAYKNSNGELFFGGVNGFNRFNPADIKDNTQPPTVVLTDFLLANQSVMVQKPNQQLGQKKSQTEFSLPKTIDALTQLTLNWQQNLISFEFAALHFTNPNKNQYAYQLEGQDKDWIYTSSKKRWATYTNLKPGNYTLHIKASNSHGYWNEQGKSLKITLLPPPWQTGWAYLIYTLVLITLVLLAYYWIADRRKRLNEQTMLLQLKQVDKLKDEFLANTSHELRTPLNGIIGLTEALIDGCAGQLPTQVKGHLSMVVSSGKRLANLVNDILDYARLESHNLTLYPRPVDLHHVTDVVLALSQHLIGNKKLVLINQIPTNLPAADADEERLQQVLYNLIGNGIKFTKQGSVTICAEQQDQWLKIIITDSGIGIAQDKFDDIFKSFEQVQGNTTRRYGGTGLGLAVSKQLIELHGGQIQVESTEGQGSTFSFTLPVSDTKSVADTKINQTPLRRHVFEDNMVLPESQVTRSPTNNNHGFRLLLVDDEPINRQVLCSHLSGHDYQLVEAPGGEEALKAVFEDGPFDLVLLDIMMPGLSGYDVCEKIRQTYPVNDLPVIFLTAKNQAIDMVDSFAVGGNDFLAKPLAKHELLARIETHLKLLDINRNLDHKVAERTSELEEKHREIAAKNREVQGINRQLEEKHREVEQKNSELVATQQQLVHSEKMASLGILTAGVAHEINNPTNFVHVSAQNLEVDLTNCQQFILNLAGDDADQEIINCLDTRFKPLHNHLGIIKEGTGRIKTIVQDLKSFSPIDSANKRTANITALLQSTVHLIQTNYSEIATFVTRFTPCAELQCHPDQLNQVFMNLIINACDAIRDQQRQQQSTALGEVTIDCHQVDNMIEISVKDSGCGMTEQTKQKLFEPFYTTKEVGEGTGLGLSISFGIVQKHDGELTVESALGVGTTFKLRLPCV